VPTDFRDARHATGTQHSKVRREFAHKPKAKPVPFSLPAGVIGFSKQIRSFDTAGRLAV
jgi:hypothetical protein